MSFAIIGLLGKKFSGKSTAARYLKERYNAEVLSFAGPLKRMAHKFIVGLQAHMSLGLPEHKFIQFFVRDPKGTLHQYDERMLSDEVLKECMLVMVTTTSSRITSEDASYEETYTDLFTLRWLMKHLGTEMCRDEISRTIWVDTALKKVREAAANEKRTLFVIDDVRFLNEVSTLRQLWTNSERWEECSEMALIVKLVCTDDLAVSGDSHASEAEIDLVPPDQIDEVVSSHRSPGSSHLIEQLDEAVGRLLDNQPVGKSSLLRYAMDASRRG